MVRKGRHEGHREKEKNEICFLNFSLHSGRWWENLNFKVIHKNLENNLDGKFLAGLQRPLMPKIKRSRWTVPWRIYSSPDGNFVNTDSFTEMMKQILFLPLKSFHGVESLHTHICTHAGSHGCKFRKILGLFLIKSFGFRSQILYLQEVWPWARYTSLIWTLVICL